MNVLMSYNNIIKVVQYDSDWFHNLTEGNFSCDCNRSIAMGISELECGDDIKIIITDENGTVLYREF